MHRLPTMQAPEVHLRGELLDPSHEAYERSRRVYNAMIDKHPRAIARCRDVADVIEAVAYGRGGGLVTAVRSGGHNGAGLGVVDHGLVIDLSPMHGIRVDPRRRTAQVEAGCTWGDVDHATHAFGLATPSGIISTTGVGGLTLGGGHGYLSRKYGLTIDNLLSADVVLADGRFVRASESEYPDLFWALRGGGGNFGVVTSFELRLHPVDTVYAGVTLYPLEGAAPVMRWYRNFMPSAPDDVYGFFAFITVPPAPPFPPELHLRKMAAIIWCYTGTPADGPGVLKAATEIGPPAFAHLGEMPYPALQSMFDGLYPPGDQWYWRGDFVHQLSDAAVDAYIDHARSLPTPQSTVHLYPIDGAVHRVASGATAFSQRDAHWSEVIVGVDHDPSRAGELKRWTVGFWNAVHPFVRPGGYVNFLGSDEGIDRVRASYGENFDRLREVKRTYDPNNFFRVNHNIPPDGR
jgi:hypothetical protein